MFPLPSSGPAVIAMGVAAPGVFCCVSRYGASGCRSPLPIRMATIAVVVVPAGWASTARFEAVVSACGEGTAWEMTGNSPTVAGGSGGRNAWPHAMVSC